MKMVGMVDAGMAKFVRQVENAIRIMELLGRNEELGVSKISQELELPKSSVYGILSTLNHKGFVDKDNERSRYSLGLKLVELGNMARANLELRKIASPFLRAINQELDETVHLTILDGWEVMYIECIESAKMLRTYSVIGVRAPLSCTAVGKAILAYFPLERVDEMITTMGLPRFTERTITDRATLLNELETIRRQGYSVDNSEHEEGVRCVGSAIRDREGKPIASISVSGPSQRISPSRDEELGRLLIEKTDGISRRLGYRDV
jgi:DNA-binding IclR family transcriptional regulator